MQIEAHIEDENSSAHLGCKLRIYIETYIEDGEKCYIDQEYQVLAWELSSAWSFQGRSIQPRISKPS